MNKNIIYNYMNCISIITITYIFIIIFQCIFFKYFVHKNINLNIEYNNKNSKDILLNFERIMTDRINLLNSNKMNFDDWIKYNIDNSLYEKDGYKYYIFIYESLKNTNEQRFVCRVHGNKNYINLSWEDILKDTTEKLSYSKYTTDPNLISNMYKLTDINSFSDINYYWVDPLTSTSSLKKTKVINYYDKNTDKKGVIGMGIDIIDLSYISKYIYINQIDYKYIIFISLLSFVMSITLFKLNKQNKFCTKSILLLLFINIYLTHFLNNKEFYGSNRTEYEKKTDINSGILSVSFLVGVNIFILSTLQNSLKLNLFSESGFVFSVSLILLLIATLKTTDYLISVDVLNDRLSTQLVFNIAILLNTLIIFNYIIYILEKKYNFI